MMSGMHQWTEQTLKKVMGKALVAGLLDISRMHSCFHSAPASDPCCCGGCAAGSFFDAAAKGLVACRFRGEKLAGPATRLLRVAGSCPELPSRSMLVVPESAAGDTWALSGVLLGVGGRSTLVAGPSCRSCCCRLSSADRSDLGISVWGWVGGWVGGSGMGRGQRRACRHDDTQQVPQRPSEGAAPGLGGVEAVAA